MVNTTTIVRVVRDVLVDDGIRGHTDRRGHPPHLCVSISISSSIGFDVDVETASITISRLPS